MDGIGVLLWWLYRVLRWFGRRKSLRRYRLQFVNWQLLSVLYYLHFKAAHTWRDFATVDRADGNWESIREEARRFCESSQETMAQVIRVRPQAVHVSLTAFVEEKGEKKVVTFARSHPFKRDAEFGLDSAHGVQKNTVFASIMGESDGHRKWQPYSYFSCNDLTKYPEEFQCDRTNWAKWYKATVVVPLRYRNTEDDTYTVIGFLTFDLNRRNGFGVIPDIFKCDFDDYHEQAAESSVIHLAGILADTLTGFLRPFLQQDGDHGKNGEEGKAREGRVRQSPKGRDQKDRPEGDPAQ